MFDLINIFEVFLPQLLRYPNPSDPLNGDAAALLLRDSKAYEMKVQDYVNRFAISTTNDGQNGNDNSDDNSDIDISDQDDSDDDDKHDV